MHLMGTKYESFSITGKKKSYNSKQNITKVDIAPFKKTHYIMTTKDLFQECKNSLTLDTLTLLI